MANITINEIVNELPAKLVFDRDFGEFEVDRLISSTTRIKSNVQNSIANSADEQYVFKTSIPKGEYMRPESMVCRTTFRIKDNNANVVLGDRSTIEPNLGIFKSAELYINDKLVDKVSNLHHVVPHKVRTRHAKEWVDSFGVSAGVGLMDTTADPLDFNYSTNVHGLGLVYSVAETASGDFDTGITVPLANNIATAVQVKRGLAGGLGYTSFLGNTPAMERAKLILNEVSYDIPLSLLFDSIKSMEGSLQHIRSFEVRLNRSDDVYNFVKSAEATDLTLTIVSMNIFHTNVQLNPEGLLFMEKKRNSPCFIPYTQFFSRVDGTQGDGVSSLTYNNSYAGLKSAFHYFLKQTTAPPNKNKRDSSSCFNDQAYTHKNVYLSGRLLDNGEIQNTATNRIQAYKDFLECCQLDEKTTSSGGISYLQFKDLYPCVSTNLQPQKMVTKNGSLYSLNSENQNLQETIYLTTAGLTNIVHIFECESLLRITEDDAVVLINSPA